MFALHLDYETRSEVQLRRLAPTHPQVRHPPAGSRVEHRSPAPPSKESACRRAAVWLLARPCVHAMQPHASTPVPPPSSPHTPNSSWPGPHTQHVRCRRAATENIKPGFFAPDGRCVYEGVKVLDVYRVENRPGLAAFQTAALDSRSGKVIWSRAPTQFCRSLPGC
jgi:hypothetical protein